MSNKKQTKEVEFMNQESVGQRQGSKIRSVHPLGMRILAKVLPEEDQTETGLYLPEGAKQSKQESVLAEVLQVASAHDDETDEEHNISGVPEGARILIGQHVGVRVPWDDELRVVETKDVLAIVEEVEVN